MNPLAVLLLKVTLVLLSGILIAAILRRHAAALRHLLWTATLSGVVLLTLTAPVTPRLPVRIAGWRAASLGTVPSLDSPVAAALRPAGSTLAAPARAPAGTPGPRFSTPQLLLLLWGSGALIVALWYVMGHVGLARIARSAVPLGNGEWDRMGHIAALDNGVKTPRIMRSRAVGSPVIWGLRRPIVLLPHSAQDWSSERCRVVLAHELAHAARGDTIAQFIGTLACALYWFHPLVWLAARRLRIESERACDDQVVSRGIPVTDYASHLLEVASGSQALRPGGIVAIGMAKPSHFEGRLLALLDERRPRSAPGPRVRALLWAALVTLLVPVALLSPVPTRAVAASIPHVQRESDSTFVKEIAASPEGRILLDLESGGSLNIRGWDESRVQIRGRLGGADWRDTRVSLERGEGGVVLRVRQATERRNSSTDHAFEINVPHRFDVRIKSAGGSVTIVDVDGEFIGESGGGGLVLERLHGQAELSTGGGDVRVTDSELTGEVSTGGGSVDFIRVRGPLRGASGSGPIRYREWRTENFTEPGKLELREKRQRVEEERRTDIEKLKARLEELRRSGERRDEISEIEQRIDEIRRNMDERREELARNEAEAARKEELARREEVTTRARTAAGQNEVFTTRTRDAEERRKAEAKRERIEETGGMLHIEKAGGDIVLESAPDGASVHTGGGRVRVGRASGEVVASTGGGDITIGPVAGSVRAETGAGNVEITLIDAEGREQSVEVGSGRGSLELVLPRSFNGRFDLETAYTRNSDRRTRIESPFDLEREETAQWDDREGTPRKYVRARGQVGEGGGWIKVRVVNGDITIRRGDR